jgi:hypothetical protein
MGQVMQNIQRISIEPHATILAAGRDFGYAMRRGEFARSALPVAAAGNGGLSWSGKICNT